MSYWDFIYIVYVLTFANNSSYYTRIVGKNGVFCLHTAEVHSTSLTRRHNLEIYYSLFLQIWKTDFFSSQCLNKWIKCSVSKILLLKRKKNVKKLKQINTATLLVHASRYTDLICRRLMEFLFTLFRGYLQIKIPMFIITKLDLRIKNDILTV